VIEQRNIVDRETWLQWRRDDVTASTVGALFGVHPYTTALRLYVEKRGVEFPSQDDNQVMRRGRWLEPSIGKAVSELRPEGSIYPPNLYLRDPALRRGGTPDFYIKSSLSEPLQAKRRPRGCIMTGLTAPSRRNGSSRNARPR
jgi:hypothetical protein